MKEMNTVQKMTLQFFKSQMWHTTLSQVEQQPLKMVVNNLSTMK